jgi:integrase/recombinase XerD
VGRLHDRLRIIPGIRLISLSALIRYARVDSPLELTRNHVVAWLGRPIKPWSRQTYWKSIQKFSEWLREFGHDPHSDLTKGIPRPKTPRAVARPIDDATVNKLLSLKLSRRAHAYIRLALYQALRVHEIAKLAAEDFDLESGWLTITGKGGATAMIPIHPEIAKLADTMPATGWWFPASLGIGHVNTTSVSITITNALRMCGSTATAHQLRDTAATRLQRQTRDIRLTQAMLRHASITSTMKYTEASNIELSQAVNALDWADKAPVTPPPADSIDMDAMSTEQLRDLAGLMFAALQARTDPAP